MLTREELEELNSASVDPKPLNVNVVRIFNDVWRTDENLVAKIRLRNANRQPTYLLRLEYKRRLEQRGL